MPHADNMLLVEDFEHWAERVLSNVAWAYYRSASDYEICEYPIMITQAFGCHIDVFTQLSTKMATL